MKGIALRLKKKITQKPNTAKQLGYERNPKTGKLEKPGTRDFNARMELQKLESESLLKTYKKRIDKEPTEANRQKLTDRQQQLDRKTNNIKTERELTLKNREKARRASLNKRQIENWVKKINSLLYLKDPKLSVNSMSRELYTKHAIKLEKKIESLAKSKRFAIGSVFVSLKAKKLFKEILYSTLQRSIVPSEFKKMNSNDAHKLMEKILALTDQRIIEYCKL